MREKKREIGKGNCRKSEEQQKMRETIMITAALRISGGSAEKSTSNSTFITP